MFPVLLRVLIATSVQNDMVAPLLGQLKVSLVVIEICCYGEIIEKHSRGNHAVRCFSSPHLSSRFNNVTGQHLCTSKHVFTLLYSLSRHYSDEACIMLGIF